MTIKEVAGAFSQNSHAAVKNLCTYLRETEMADPAAELPANIGEWQIWDEIELLALWYTGEGRKWEPRRPLQDWLRVHGQNQGDTAAIILALVSDLNTPSETAIPLDFYVPTAEIRKWTYRALQDFRMSAGYMDFMPDLPPTVRAQFQEWDTQK